MSIDKQKITQFFVHRSTDKSDQDCWGTQKIPVNVKKTAFKAHKTKKCANQEVFGGMTNVADPDPEFSPAHLDPDQNSALIMTFTQHLL